MIKRTLFVTVPLLGLSLGTTPCLQSQAKVVIGGRVYDADTNVPLPGVRISTVSPPAGSAPPVVALARSQDDGNFALSVPPGPHVICVDAGKAYLDPCNWAPGTTVIDTARSSTLNLPLRKGVLLVVNVHDPNGSAQAARQANPALAAVPAPPVAVTVHDASGAVRPIPFVESSAASYRFALVVPPATDFNLKVTSELLRLADSAGSPIAQNVFQAAVTSPAASDLSSVPVLPMGRFSGPQIPSKTFEL